MSSRSTARYRRLAYYVAAAILAGGGGAALVVALPWLPRAPDLYVHRLWSWEVMRCLAQGQLPVWLPDLNAGFGSPGTRLYSRIMLFSLVGRAASSAFLAIPLLWWSIERLLVGRIHAGRDGAVVAGLWLMHGPSALMAGWLGGTSLLLHRTLNQDSVPRHAGGRRGGPGRLALAAFAGGVLRAGRAGGPHRRHLRSRPQRPWLGLAPCPNHNIWLGWLEVGLLASVLLTRSWKHHPRRTAAAMACIVMASPIAFALWRLESPLQQPQLSWRWLLPATLVLVPAVAGARVRRTAGIACVVLPSLLMVWIGWMRVSDLGARQPWHVVGGIPLESLGANPLFVNAAQSRPSSFGALRPNLRLFGDSQAVVASGAGTVMAVHRWSPLLREVEVVANTPVTIGFRILDYPYWAVSSDGAPEVAAGGMPGVVSCRVPEGRHLVSIRWVGNPLAVVGQMAAALTILLLIVGLRSWGGGLR